MSKIKHKIVFEDGQVKGLGYLKSFNSHKDYSEENEQVKPILNKLKKGAVKKLAASKDLRKMFTPVRDQGDIGSCTAFSAAAMIEFIQKKAYRKYTQVSPLFIYKITRRLLD